MEPLPGYLHPCQGGAMCRLADGRLAVAGIDGAVRLLPPMAALASAEAASLWLGKHRGAVRALAEVPDAVPGATRLVTGSDDGTARLWLIADGDCRCLWSFDCQQPVTRALARKNADGSAVVDLLFDYGVTLTLDLAGDPAGQISQHHCELVAWAGATSRQITLHDGRLAAPYGTRGAVIWRDGAAEGAIIISAPISRPVRVLAQLVDGTVATGSDEAGWQVCLWDPVAGRCRQRLRTGGWVCALLALPDGRLVSGSWGGAVRVWRRDPNGLYWMQHVAHVGSNVCALEADGTTLAASTWDGRVHVWALAP